MACPQAASHTDHWSVAFIGLVLCPFCTHGRHQVAASGTEAANAEPHPLPPSTAEKHSVSFLYGGVRLFWIKRDGGKLWSNSNEAGDVSGHWIPEQPFYLCVCVWKSLSRVPTVCDSMASTVFGNLQARILEWVAFSFSRGSSQPRDQTQVSSIAGRFFTSWATRETIVFGILLIQHS